MADTKARAMIFRQVTNFSDASTLFTNSTSPTVSVDEGEAGDESSLASFNLEHDWFIPFWIVLSAFWLMYPCLSNRRRRRRWWRRLKERRWDISEGGIAPGRATTDSLAFEIWGEEAPLLRSALTDILLREFTKELSGADFVGPSTESFSQLPLRSEGDPPNVEETHGDAPNADETHADLKATDPEEGTTRGSHQIWLPPPGLPVHRAHASIPTGSADAEAGGDGYGLADAVQQPRRTVPDGCAVCMEPMCSGDRVCWSANEACPHAFHEECILDWLLVLGNKKRMRQIRADPGSAEVVAAEVLTDFPMQCPCCRQDFVKAKAKLITPSEEGGDVENVVEDVMVEAVEP